MRRLALRLLALALLAIYRSRLLSGLLLIAIGAFFAIHAPEGGRPLGEKFGKYKYLKSPPRMFTYLAAGGLIALGGYAILKKDDED